MKEINSIKKIENFEDYSNLFVIDQSLKEINPTGTFKDKQPQALAELLPKKFPNRKITIGAMSTGNTAYSILDFAGEYNKVHGKLIIPVIYIPEELEQRLYFGPDTNRTRILAKQYIKILQQKANSLGGRLIKLNFGIPGKKSEKDYLSSLRLAKVAYEIGLVDDLFINITEGLEDTSFITKEQIERSIERRFSEKDYKNLPKEGIKAYQIIIKKGLEDLQRTYGVIPNYIICQFGAGILYNEILDYIKENKLNIKVIPVAVGDSNSCADKIYASYWTENPQNLKIFGTTKSKHDGNLVYNVEDWEIGYALNQLKNELNAEASGVAGFAILYRLKEIIAELDKNKDIILTINTGNGIENFQKK